MEIHGAAAPLPCRGGAGVGSVYIPRRKSYRPHPQPLPYKGGEGLRIVLYGVCPCPHFFKSTHYSSFATLGSEGVIGAKLSNSTFASWGVKGVKGS